MQLPFLKHKKWPRIAKPMEQKSYGLSPDEQIEDYIIGELLDSCEKKDVSAFRRALEALVLQCFDDDGEEAAHG